MKHINSKFYDIISIGSITTDIFVRPCQLPVFEKDNREYFSVEVGEKIPLEDVFRSGGGSAGNSAIGFSRLGLSVYPIGVIGDDEEGEHIIRKFEDNGISTQGLVIEKDSSSSISFILNAEDGRRTVLHHRATSTHFNATVLEKAPNAKGVYVGHLYPSAESILTSIHEWKQKYGGFFAWNPGKTQFKQGLSVYAKIMKVTDVLILNVEEAEQFTRLEAPHIPAQDLTEDVFGKNVSYGKPIPVKYGHDVRALAQVFLNLGVRQVVITDGQRGTQVFTENEHFQMYAKDDICVSSLGAGDAFSVGVIAAFLEKKNLPDQLRWGSVCATNVVKQFGAQHGYVTRQELAKELS